MCVCVCMMHNVCTHGHAVAAAPQTGATQRQESLEALAARLKKKTDKQAKQISALKRAHHENEGGDHND